ncbi:MAG: adenylate/guanylate cyclase domain-containing protein [Thermodesulfobacteriota bacterium]
MAVSPDWIGKRFILTGVLAGFLWGCLALILLYSFPGPFKTLDNRVYDWKLAFFAKTEVSPVAVHVDLDDQAIKKYGQWPWDRQLSARIVERLTELGAKVIVFDIVYTSQGHTAEGDAALFRSVAESGRVVSALGLIETDPGAHKNYENSESSRVEAVYGRGWQLNVPREFTLGNVNAPRDSALPLLPIIQGSRHLGHINSTPDKDGIHRRIPLFFKIKDRVIPSLSLASLVAYWDIRPDQIELSPQGCIRLPGPQGTCEIPVDFQGNLLINWKPYWESFEHFTALDLLEGDEDPSRISRYKDKIVIVSIAWTGTSDIGPNPLEKEVLLSRVHSSALDTMMTGRFINEIAPWPVLVCGSFIALLLFLGRTATIRLKQAVLPCLAICLGFMGFIVAAFAIWSLEIPLVEPLFVFLPGTVIGLVVRGIGMERERHMIREIFGRYVSDEVVTEILKSPSGVNLRGELRDVTVLVSDLRGFTPMTEALEPTSTLAVINRYLEKMVNIIMQYRGLIVEFTGDGIFVLFGVPQAMEDHTRHAVICALAMQEAMSALNSEYVSQGLPELRMGIAINCGQTVVGNIGSEKRLKYGALGSAVNITFRVEAQAGPGEILLTEAAYERLSGQVHVSAPRTVQLKGIRARMRLFPVTEISI